MRKKLDDCLKHLSAVEKYLSAIFEVMSTAGTYIVAT